MKIDLEGRVRNIRLEQGQAPTMLVGEKVQAGRGMAGPDGRGGRQQTAPYAPTNQPAQASRPIYPFPQIAHAKGNDLSQASKFSAAPSDVQGQATQPWIGSEMLTMRTPSSYRIVDGKVRQQ